MDRFFFQFLECVLVKLQVVWPQNLPAVSVKQRAGVLEEPAVVKGQSKFEQKV